MKKTAAAGNIYVNIFVLYEFTTLQCNNKKGDLELVEISLLPLLWHYFIILKREFDTPQTSKSDDCVLASFTGSPKLEKNLPGTS